MRLFYFTQSYPFGLGEQWKTNELNVLVNHFDEIIVIPFTYAGNFDNPKPLPLGVKVEGPLFGQLSFQITDIFKVLFHSQTGIFFSEFFRKKVIRKKLYFGNWLKASVTVIKLLKHPIIQKILNRATKEDVLYFYWGRGSCEMIPFIDVNRFHKVFVRMHGFDLFETRSENDGYIPFRKYLLESASVIAPTSQAGRNHLISLYPAYANKIKVTRCGTVANGKYSTRSDDNILRVVSCAMLTPVKRMHLVIEALQYVNFPIKWYHIGDGYLRQELEELIDKLEVRDKFHFVGLLDSCQVLEFYTSHSFDLFVNTSESEGIPFSIMEAYSVGIPAMATDVGGTGEIVTNELGKLIEKDITGKSLAAYLADFYNLSKQEKENLRKKVIDDYERKWNAVVLTNELATMLKN